ncbi:hypothetical protein ACJJTC_002457 [Scirpophaga incertulas]
METLSWLEDLGWRMWRANHLLSVRRMDGPNIGWRLLPDEIESDHRLITFEGASGPDPSAESQWDEPMKLRDRSVNWAQLLFIDGSLTRSVKEAMHSLLYTLCPDDDQSGDTPYHRQVRLMASISPSGVVAVDEMMNHCT